jgi:hypothetical protein
MTFQNFRSAMNAVEMEQLKAYLSANGWLEQISSGRINFSKQVESTGESVDIFVPTDAGHPKFRSLLQNLLFSLSVHEQREPIEIAGDMARIKCVSIQSIATVEPSKTVALTGSTSQYVMLRNTSSSTCPIHFADQFREYPLEPNQVALVVLSGSSKPCIIDIEGPTTIHRTHTGDPGIEGHKVLFALPALTWKMNSAELSQYITSNFRMRGSLESAIKRFCFMSEDSTEPSTARSETLLRAIATLVCNLVKNCEESEESRNKCFELVRLLLAPMSMTFSLDLGHAQSLWNTMRNEDVDLPSQGHHWLKERVTKIDSSAES